MKRLRIILVVLLLQILQYSFAGDYNIPVRGLPNLGSSCYMNSVLQCLFQVPEFAQLVKEKAIHDVPFLDECRNVLDALDKNDNEEVLAATTQLFEQISECLFDGSDEQQDALDLFVYIVSNIPELQPLFCLSLNTKISCAECNTILKSANQTIYDLPLDTFASQIVKGINCPECEISQTTACKKSKINNLPQYILVNCDQLYGQNGTNALKNLQDIQSKLSDYELVGTILYAGNKENGHYIAQIRENSTRDWHLCNDMHIVKFENLATKKQENEVSDKNNLVAFLPRILFYSKKQQNCATKVS